ncbi:MAG: hypothetical protein ACUVQ6_02235 [Dissulfurimicrobium sp.]|uniref:hypothetical protein n=1 Tax=Dissulfurimicrobium sp. TaxID=2022436 RepID=UPI004049D79B
MLLKENATPGGLAAAAAVGTLWLLGSVVVAPAGSLVTGLSVYAMSYFFMGKRGA